MAAFPQGKFKHTFEWSGTGHLTVDILRNIVRQVEDVPGDATVRVNTTDNQMDGTYTYVTIDYSKPTASWPQQSPFHPSHPTGPNIRGTAGGRIEEGA